MKKLAFLTLVFFLVLNVCMAQKFNIRDFGAKSDNSSINTLFIQNAIDSCSSSGGGTVYVPPGSFITGTIKLKSNVNLHLDAGAELKGSPNLGDYKEYQAKNYEKTHYGIIYTHKQINVSITGQGAINGNEKVFFDWERAKKIEWGGTKSTRQKDEYRAVKSGIGDGPVVPKQRPYQMIIFSECKNVLIRDVQILKSPYWALHLADCDGAIVSGVKIWASLLTPNSDGLDITSCNNVIVSNCDIRTGDDAIAIMGYATYFELPGYHNLRHPSGNITVTNCNLQSRSSGIRIGFIDHNTIRNIHISNVNITNSNRGIGIFVRGEGSVENITISQVNIDTRLHTGDWWGNGEPIHISAVPGSSDMEMGKIRNVTFRDIACSGENGILIYGSEKSVIEDVRIYNLSFQLNKSKLNNVAGGNIDLRGAFGNKQLFSSDISAFYAQYVKNLRLNDISISWDGVTEEYFKYGIHVKEFNKLQLTNIKVSPSPSNKILPAVLIENGKEFNSDIENKYLKKMNLKE